MNLNFYDLLLGDAKEVLKDYDDDTFDSVVCDPPYGINFMNRKWDYDVPSVELWKEVYRVLKPGGHLLSFAGTRTYHRMAVNIEDAGFAIRDQIMWVFGTGFPKSTSISKQIDKRNARQMSWFGPWFKEWRKKNGITQKEVAAFFPSKNGKITGCVGNWEAGRSLPTNEQYNFLCDYYNLPFETLEEAEREIVASRTRTVTEDGTWAQNAAGGMHSPGTRVVNETKAATDLAKKWEGWGTALKPAHEPIVVARKPFSGPVVENVLKHTTGALNIDATRITHEDPDIMRRNESSPQSDLMHFGPRAGERGAGPNPQGRWPANLMLTHHSECTLQGSKKVGQGNLKQGSYRQKQEDNLYDLGMMKKEGALQVAPDNYGTETIEDWDCVDGCPIKMLDDQSGLLGAGHAPKKSKGNPFGGENDSEREEIHFGSGGASRFFHNTAHEPIVMARKPFKGPVAENVLEHGTGALNIDGTRIETGDETFEDKTAVFTNRKGGDLAKTVISGKKGFTDEENNAMMVKAQQESIKNLREKGRFPTNLIHDGSDEVIEHFPNNNPGCKPHRVTAGDQSVKDLQEKGWGFGGTDKVAGYEDGDNLSAARFFKEIPPEERSMWYNHGESDGTGIPQGPVYNDKGSAARFFYCAKPNRKERDAGLATLESEQWDFTRNEGDPGGDNPRNRGAVKRSNYHPTVKPLKLMRYLCRLVTPPNGLVLDPFTGSGTTGIAALQEGFNFIGVELDPNYVTLATHRIDHWLEEDQPKPKDPSYGRTWEDVI